MPSYGLPSSLWDQGTSILSNASDTLLKYSNASEKRRFAITTVSVVFSSYVLWKVLFRKRPPPNQVKLVSGGLPYLGHLPEITRDPVAFINRCKKENGPAFRIHMNGQEIYVLTGTLIQQMLRAPKYFDFVEGIQSIVPIDRAIHVSYDHKFKGEELTRRDKHPVIYPIKHNFTAHQIHVFSERIQLGLSKALGNLLNLNPGEKKIVPVWDILSLTVSQISCLCFAGNNVGANQDLVRAMASFTQNVIRTGMALAILPGWIADFVAKRYLSVEPQIDLIMELLVPELEKIRSGELVYDQPTFSVMTLDLPKANGRSRTPKEAAFHFKDVALASIHTTTQFASFTLHELACRPALVAELRAEIEKLDERTPEKISQIRLLDSLLREVLRYNVHILGMHHKVTQDVVLSTGEMIPQGSLVMGAMFDAHTSEMMIQTTSLGLPLDQFDAHRYVNADPNEMWSSSAGAELMTFGMFAHACPGRFFAVSEIKYIIAELIMRYNISTQSGQRAKDFLLRGMTRFPPREPLVFEGRSS
ncbi:cytochrome P450 [Fennellomyces sp. T-0311]|nr:cytochrome P450 [Fennellomyces sp. T-0311]